ncbi:ATP-binding protein [Pseudonocardia nematodicida]|uniref:ATP-binding protein n=1 Tax=Pseudonocardia nematodicida TaxID=1206997 RepID=A0ABV1KCS5_9PSEU
MIRLRDEYTAGDFAALIERESDEVELKTGTSAPRLQEPMVAFSNTDGGVILIGVSDDRTVQGRRLDQGTDDKIHEAAMSVHHPGRYSVREIRVDGKPVVAVLVRRREEGFAQTSDGRLLVRRGGRNVPLIGDAAFTFMGSRALKRFERADSEIPITTARPDSLEELCRVYTWTSESDHLADRLRERGLAVGENLTIAGALITTNPADTLHLSKAVVEVRRYSDDGPDYDRRETFGGPLPDQVRDATEFVVSELGSDLIVAGVHRYEIPKLPLVVLRESIANAVAHRSYEVDRMVTLVELRGDRVQVTSPGRLPEPVTIATIREAQAARNPCIIDALRRFRLAEDAGRGVDVIEDEMEQALLDPPVFTEEGNTVSVVLPLNGPITSRERGWLADLTAEGSIENQDRILLVHAARGYELNNTVARSLLKTDDSGFARRALHRLRDADLLEQHGARGGATYTLKGDIAPPASYRLNLRQLGNLVVDTARTEDLSNERVRELTGLGRQQALQLLQGLVREGRLTQIGQRRGTRYYADGAD